MKAALRHCMGRVALNLGEHFFRAVDRADAALVIIAIDGTPCVTLPE